MAIKTLPAYVPNGMAPTKPTRRQVLASAGTATLAATAGVFYASDSAQAVEIDMHELQIPEQGESAPDAPEKVMLRLTGDYTVEANVTPDTLVLTPRAKTADSALGMHDFQAEELQVSSPTASGQIDLERDLLALSGLRDAFPTTEGETVTKEVVVELAADVRKDGASIGTATAKRRFPLTLGHEAAQASIGFCG